MSLHGEVLIVDTVLTRSVEVELSKLVGVILGNKSAVGQDDLETGAQILKLSLVGLRNMEVQRVGVDIVNVVSLDDNGRLTLALRAGRVVLVQSVPVQRATGVGIVERVDVDGAISRTGEKRCAVQARGRGRSNERKDRGSELHLGLKIMNN